MPPPLPRCSGGGYASLILPSRISLPRKGRRVGLHIGFFEKLWGRRRETSIIVAVTQTMECSMPRPKDEIQDRPHCATDDKRIVVGNRWVLFDQFAI